MIDRYIGRTNSSFYGGILDRFCFAEFLRHYYLAPIKSIDNDYEPEILQDDLIEYDHISEKKLPDKSPYHVIK